MSRKKFILLLLTFALSAAVLLPAAPARALTTKLRVGYNNGFGIYQSTNNHGRAEGIHIDIMNLLAEELSLSIEYIPYVSTAACYEALNSGEIDLVLGAPAGATLPYPFLVVDSLSTYSLCLIASNETMETAGPDNVFTGYRAAVESGHNYPLMSQTISNNRTVFSNNLFVIAHSQAQALDWLIDDRASIALCELESSIQYLRERGVSDQFTVAISHLIQAGSVILTRETDYGLYFRIRTALSSIRSSGAYDRILEKWLSEEESGLSEDTLRTIVVVIVLIFLFTSLYVLISTRMRRNLAQQVEQRTKELLHINEVLSSRMEQLRHENDLRNNIIQNAASAMIIYDQDRKVSFLNRPAYRTIGPFRGNPLGRSVDELPVFGPLLSLSGVHRQDSLAPVLLALPQGSKTRYFRCARYLLPAEENSRQFLFSAEDVTAEEREKQSLFEMEKNRVLNTIIAGIAHEIKNPLTAIKAFSTLIPTHKNNLEFMESFSRLVPKETERINSLIGSLINYARPSRGEITTINLTELARNCIALTVSLAQKAGIDPQLRAERDYFIRGNRDHIQQALINYLMNAIDAIQERPPEDVPGRSALLCVFLSQRAERIVLEVYDEGVGMDEDALRQCMDPFYTTKAKGTGLGMAMALQAIRENGGEVRVESAKNAFTRIILEFERCKA